MFSGIISSVGRILAINRTDYGAQLQIEAPAEAGRNLTSGASIAVNGVCLTLVRHENKAETVILVFDLVHETLARSNLKELQADSEVNLERSLKFGDEVGGHPCSGHVDSTVKVISIEQLGEGAVIEFGTREQFNKFILEKGFIALNGASLTVASKLKSGFTVAFIPETLRRTNLGKLRPGSEVNMEIDRQTQAIVETVERVLGKA